MDTKKSDIALTFPDMEAVENEFTHFGDLESGGV